MPRNDRETRDNMLDYRQPNKLRRALGFTSLQAMKNYLMDLSGRFWPYFSKYAKKFVWPQLSYGIQGVVKYLRTLIARKDWAYLLGVVCIRFARRMAQIADYNLQKDNSTIYQSGWKTRWRATGTDSYGLSHIAWITLDKINIGFW